MTDYDTEYYQVPCRLWLLTLLVSWPGIQPKLHPRKRDDMGYKNLGYSEDAVRSLMLREDGREPALHAYPEDVHCGQCLWAAEKLQDLLGVLAACPGVIPHQEQQLHSRLEAATANVFTGGQHQY